MEQVRDKGREDRQLPLEAVRAPRCAWTLRDATPASLNSEAALSSLHQSAADSLSVALSGHLHAEVKAVTGGFDILPYSDFLLALEPTTWIGVLHIDPPGVQACIDIPRGLLELALERLADEPVDSTAHAPASTGISHALQAIASGLMAHWSDRAGRGLSVRLDCLETNPTSLRIMPGDERVTVLRLETTLAGTGARDASGVIRLCLPQPLVQHLIGAASPSGSLDESDQADVELRAVLAGTRLRLSDLLAMQVGDVITTDQPIDSPASLEIDDDTAVACIPGQLRKMRAVRIIQPPHSLRAGRGSVREARGESA